MMDQLFSCRNCVHNAGQSLNIGPGQGFCIQHNSIIAKPDDTTCKYHHRKDLPSFVVDEGRSEHAGEFAAFPALVSLRDREPVWPIRYSEKYYWESKQFDPLNNALAQYHGAGRSWIFVGSFAGSSDGRRALVHGCLVRRYMNQCGTWTSSYRMALALVQEMTIPRMFSPDVLVTNGDGLDSVEQEARWDVFFAQLSGIQEYGWHAGLERLMWASDEVNGGLSELDWTVLKSELSRACPGWLDLIIEHAKDNDGFFPQMPGDEEQS